VCPGLWHDLSAAPVQVACLRHFQTEPLSALAAAAGKGPAALRAAVDALPERVCRGDHPGSTASLRAEVQAALDLWSGWAAVLHWVNAAARSVNMGHPAGEGRAFSILGRWPDRSIL
jgi:hypothetical protein